MKIAMDTEKETAIETTELMNVAVDTNVGLYLDARA
jgi:hypothetical protein